MVQFGGILSPLCIFSHFTSAIERLEVEEGESRCPEYGLVQLEELINVYIKCISCDLG
jgi:hypothetical protein